MLALVIIYAISDAELNADYDNTIDVNNDKAIFVGRPSGPSRRLDLYAEGEQTWQEVVRFFRHGADPESLIGSDEQRASRADMFSTGVDYIRGPYLQGMNPDSSAVGFLPPPQYSGDLRADVLWHPPLPPGANKDHYKYNTEQWCIRLRALPPGSTSD